MPRKKDKPKDNLPITKIKTELRDESSPEPVRLFSIFKSKNQPSTSIPVIDLCGTSVSSQESMSELPKLIPKIEEPIVELSDSNCSPPELEEIISPYISPSAKRVTRKSTRFLSYDSMAIEEDEPLSEVKKKKQKLTEKSNKLSDAKVQDPAPLKRTSKNLKSETKPKERTPKEDLSKGHSSKSTKHSNAEETPAIVNKPKFNVVHADKMKNLASSGIRKNTKRFRSPSPLTFDIVLRKPNKRKPRKKVDKPVRQESNTQTTDGKIDRIKDLCCEGCDNNLTRVTSSQGTIQNSVFNACLQLFMPPSQPAITQGNNEDNGKHKPMLRKFQSSKTVVARTCAPSHKIPTVKPKESDQPTNQDDNTKSCDMDIEKSPEPQLSNVTFNWDQQQSTNRYPTPEYGPHDFLKVNRQMPSCIPQGAFTSKAIEKWDDVARIGQFKELYDNPLRPKLLDVEHPPEEANEQSLLKSNVAFFGEFEPEIPEVEPESELIELLNSISDDETEDEAKFSDDEEDARMSDTCSVVAMDTIDELENDFNIDEMFNGMTEGESNLQEFLDSDMFGSDAIETEEVEKERPPTPQEPHPVRPSKRIEAEMSKNFNKTPLEMVDDELDFDDEDDDVQSPAYEPITVEKDPLLLQTNETRPLPNLIPIVKQTSLNDSYQSKSIVVDAEQTTRVSEPVQEETQQELSEDLKVVETVVDDLNVPPKIDVDREMAAETLGSPSMETSLISPPKTPGTPLLRPTPVLVSFKEWFKKKEIESVEKTIVVPETKPDFFAWKRTIVNDHVTEVTKPMPSLIKICGGK